MQLVKTRELNGGALDWAVAVARGWTDVKITGFEDPNEPDYPFFRPTKEVDGVLVCGSGLSWAPSVSWSQGGPLIDHFDIELARRIDPVDKHSAFGNRLIYAVGPTKLIAAMRCIVAEAMGYRVLVPDVLLRS